MGYSKRTIERERALGLTEQLKPASKNIKTCGDLQKNNGSTWLMWRKGVMKKTVQAKEGL